MFEMVIWCGLWRGETCHALEQVGDLFAHVAQTLHITVVEAIVILVEDLNHCDDLAKLHSLV